MDFEFFKQFGDEDYFREDPRMIFLSDAVHQLDAKIAIRIGGPREWDPTLHPMYQAFAGYKFPLEMSRMFNPESRAKMILIEMATGTSEMIPFPVIGKSPSLPPPPLPSTGTLRGEKSISFPATKFPGPWSTWRLFVYSGNVFSNPLDFETGHRELTEKDRQIPLQLLRMPIKQELSSQVFARRPASPQLNAPGIAFAQEAGEASVDATRWLHPLDLTVFVPDNLPPQQRWIPVRLLFGSDVNGANHSMEILIPKESTTKVEGGLVGHYTLDLAPLLIDSSTGKPVQPKEWYLTAICKGVFSGPQALTVPVR